MENSKLEGVKGMFCFRNQLMLLLTFCMSGVFGQLKWAENKGQWNESVLYRARLSYGACFAEKDRFTFHILSDASLHALDREHHEKPDSTADLTSYVFNLRFSSHDDADIEPLQPFPYYENFFIGNDPRKWANHVKNYRALLVKDITPNASIKAFSDEGHLRFDWIVKPGADVSTIFLEVNGVNTIINKKGDLLLLLGKDTLTLSAPLSYQTSGASKKQIPSRYRKEGKKVYFEFPEGYDSSKELVIDPTLIFSTYTGSLADNFGFTATYDPEGCFYAGGIARAAGYITTPGVFQSTYAGGVIIGQFEQGFDADMSLTKFNPTGDSLRYSTYIGGTVNDQPHSLVTNSSGELFIYGRSNSQNFPVSATAYRTFNSGNMDIVITRLNATGSTLLASTYYGGALDDGANISPAPFVISSLKSNYADDARGEIILDAQSNVYVVSCTRSTNIPLVNSLQPSLGGTQDGCLLKFPPNLSFPFFTTYLGGIADDALYSLDLMSNGNIVVTGGTGSTNLPSTPGVVDGTFNGGLADGFIAVINNAGTSIQALTYFGTSNYDQCYFVKVDGDDNVYLYGQTAGVITPTPGTFSNPNSGQFIISLTPDLGSYNFRTVFGSGDGNPDISPTAFLVDKCRNIYISGWGSDLTSAYALSTVGLTVTPDAYKSVTDSRDFYFMVLGENASSLVYATFFGGNESREHVDGGTSRFDEEGIIYQSVCAGCGGYDDFPYTPGAWSATNNSVNPQQNCNLGAAKFKFDLPEVRVDVEAQPDVTGCVPLTIQFLSNALNASNYLWSFGDGSFSSLENPQKTYTQTGVFQVTLFGIDTLACRDTVFVDTSILFITVEDDSVSAVFDYVITDDCDPYVASFTFQGSNASSYSWNFGDGFTSTLQNPAHTYQSPGTYVVTLTAVNSTACNQTNSYSRALSFLPKQDINVLPSDTSGCVPFTTQFIPSLTGASQYFWQFGDGSFSTQPSPTHTYSIPGTFAGSLTVNNPSYCNPLDTAFFSVETSNLTLTAGFSYIILAETCDSIRIAFLSTSQNADSLFWTTSDGQVSSFSNPTFTFTGAGNFTVSLSASSLQTCNPSSTYNESFIILPSVFAAFAVDTLGCIPFTTTFLNLTNPPATDYLWNFGDGSISTMVTPQHTYSLSDTYSGFLVATDSTTCNIVDTAYFEINTSDIVLTADFISTVVHNSCDSLIISFSNQSQNAEFLIWSSSDGQTSTQSGPVFRYYNSGTYIVTLTTSSTFTCNTPETKSDTFVLAPALIALQSNDGSGCIPFTNLFINQTSADSAGYFWDFGDGNFSMSISPQHTYTTEGQFNGFLLAIDSSTCNITDTAFFTITTSDDSVMAAFTFTDSIFSCDSLQVITFNQSQSATSYIWIWGDGSSSTDVSPTHFYRNQGSHVITLIAINNSTCNARDTAVAQTFLPPPVSVSFEADTGCSPYSYELLAEGENVANYQWFQNGLSVSTEEMLTLSEVEAGVYYTVIVATNPSSCNLTAIDSGYVVVGDTPSVSFSVFPDSTEIFNPIQFEAEVSPGAVIVWDFDDGETSIETAPLHVYREVGAYIPCLTATSTLGCIGSACKDVLIVFRRTIGVPNAFSPNGDGINDVLYVEGYGITEMVFRIYNRWGELVFESTDPAIGWDGRFREKGQEMDVYAYTLEAKFLDGSNSGLLKGNITLLR